MNKLAKITAGASGSFPDYERDGYGWAMAQGSLLRQRRFDAIDWDNVAEEIETMGRGERREYKSHLIRVLIHMLKWEAQPERRGRSWWSSIMHGRQDAVDALDENPSLKPLLGEIHGEALAYARKKAALETDIDQAVYDAIEISERDAFDRDYVRPEND